MLGGRYPGGCVSGCCGLLGMSWRGGMFNKLDKLHTTVWRHSAGPFRSPGPAATLYFAVEVIGLLFFYAVLFWLPVHYCGADAAAPGFVISGSACAETSLMLMAGLILGIPLWVFGAKIIVNMKIIKGIFLFLFAGQPWALIGCILVFSTIMRLLLTGGQ